MKKIVIALLAVGSLALCGCSGDKTWKADDELSEAVHYSFVRDKMDRFHASDDFIDQETQERCSRLDEGEKYEALVKEAQNSEYPGFEIAVLIGATTWYCAEFEQ